ncbi:MAG: orotidine-5'-phosphate decarboxylase [Minisyncoccota bacterium]
MSSSRTKLIFAPDGLSIEEAINLTRKIGHHCRAVKVHDLFDEGSGEFLYRLSTLGAIPWVDAKLYDKPSAAAKRAVKIAQKGARIISVHAAGGVAMMKAIVEELHTTFCNHIPPPLVWAVTLPTWLDDNEIAQSHGADRMPGYIALGFALKAKEAGVDGVTCPQQYVRMLKEHPDMPEGMTFVTPGVRSVGAKIGDQKRVGTPQQAIKDGADAVVVASQVVDAENPEAEFYAIAAEIGAHIRADEPKVHSQHAALH